jgi:hypothetical protein
MGNFFVFLLMVILAVAFEFKLDSNSCTGHVSISDKIRAKVMID